MTLPPSTPDLLLRLRAVAVEPDWRRGARVEITSYEYEMAASAVSWSAAERAEAHLLLARIAVDPLRLVRAAIELAEAAPARRGEAYVAMRMLARKWPAVLNRLATPAERGVLIGQVTAALRAFVQKAPLAVAPRLAQATILNASGVPGAALDNLAAAPNMPRDVAAMYLDILGRRLTALLQKGIIARAFAVPTNIQFAAPENWLVFVLMRALCARVALQQPDVIGRLRDLDPAGAEILESIEPSDADIRAKTMALLDAARASEPSVAARMLRQSAITGLLLSAHDPDAEWARETLLAEASGLAEAQMDIAGGSIMPFAAVLNLLPSCERFWCDHGFRRSQASRMVALLNRMNHAETDAFLGLFAFMAEDHDAARDAFARLSKAVPAPIGPSTYFDSRDVPPLANPGSVSTGTPDPLLVTTLQDRAGSVEQAMTLVISANGAYLERFGPTYARKLAPHAHGTGLHVHLVGDPAAHDATLELMRAALAGTRLTMTSEPLTVAEPYYFALARFLRLAELRRLLPGTMLVTDIDLGWPESPFDFSRRMMHEADVGLSLRGRVRLGTRLGLPGIVRLYPPTVPWHTVAAWAVALSATPEATAFADLVARVSHEALSRAMTTGASGKWGIDQNVLLASYTHASRHMPEVTFADLGFQTDLEQSMRLPPQPPLAGKHWLVRDAPDIV